MNCCAWSGSRSGRGYKRKNGTTAAARGILSALDGEASRKECRMTVQASTGSEALDLDVSCSPMTLEQQLFVIFRLQDISHEKRRRVLERFFFHDVLNTAGVTQNLATLLAGMVRSEEQTSELQS